MSEPLKSLALPLGIVLTILASVMAGTSYVTQGITANSVKCDANSARIFILEAKIAGMDSALTAILQAISRIEARYDLSPRAEADE